MTLDKKILAVIPARGGSKRLPKKNIRLLCEKPLIAWTIERALECSLITEVHVSTDSSEIAAVSKQYGVPVPYLRPARLATDTATSVDVLLHTLDCYRKNGQEFDYIALLEPTSPLRKSDDLEQALRIALETPEADGVISLGEIHMEQPAIVKRVNASGYLEVYMQDPYHHAAHGQQFERAYFPYGVIYLIKVDVLEEKKTIYTEKMLPLFIERWQNYEVDDLCDFLCIESIIQARMRGDI